MRNSNLAGEMQEQAPIYHVEIVYFFWNRSKEAQREASVESTIFAWQKLV